MNVLPACTNVDEIAEPLYYRLLSDYQKPLPPLLPKHRLFFDPTDHNQRERYTAMSVMMDGVGMTKVITASDILNSVESYAMLSTRQGGFSVLPFGALNVLRTAISAVVALRLGNVDTTAPLAIIGAGRINRLVTRYAHRFLGIQSFAAVNRSGDYTALEQEVKHSGITLVTGRDGLRGAASVVACTTNDDPTLMLTEEHLPNVRKVVVLDGGNSLSGLFRRWTAFADVPDHWKEVAKDEFWDGGHYPLTWLPLCHPVLPILSTSVVWLLGNALADLRAAQIYLEALHA